MSAVSDRTAEHAQPAADGRSADVPGFPPSVAVAMFVALVAGLFAYGQTPGAPPRMPPVAAELGPALDDEAAEGWLAAQATGGRQAADIATGTFVGDSIEALL